MILEINCKSPEELVNAIAKAVDTEVIDGTMQIPAIYGKGYIKGISILNGPTIMIRQYELLEELNIKTNATGANGIVLTFHNIYQDQDTRKNHKLFRPFAQIESAGIDYQELFPSKTRFNTIIIMIDVEQLKALINPRGDRRIMHDILCNDKPFIYEELISPDMHGVANQILSKVMPGHLQDFFYRVKAEELILLLFTELERRDIRSQYALNDEDIKKIYLIKDNIVEDLSINPSLVKLASSYGMSESKITRLFRQIFGNSIYSYYQSFRMDYAGYLIKENNLSIAEIGYQLGFSNLSHFARLFERYNGLTPKKYAKFISIDTA
ncbi:helix-turn-helix transcriptional regulator [Pedobacter mendelii]|uniref:AraC family transcriptional regulator n=1 Tax=Pedobacter mendelii TaxID=1908240 RepID=A0ABQ2BM60_9SPHI|nr:AraC family transcriptional regulator [Pedobacter mendelii]GGI27973.1 AraC family transcriptional regulator [Pedobacter mendelii]